MRLTPLLVIIAIALLDAATLPAAPAPRHAAARSAVAASKPAPAATRATAVRLPDSVLVRLPGPEDISRRRFERAVRLLGGNPDSLTPADRDRFLELVTEQRLLAARATASALPWHRADSLVFESERDNILVRAALALAFTRIEARRRALGQPDLNEEAMGIAARESLMLELAPTYDRELLRVIGSYFAELPQSTAEMSPMEQIKLTRLMPKVPPSDTGKVLARSARLGEFKVSQLLSDWSRLSSVYRPHVATDEQLRAIVENSLFERLIRIEAARPEVASEPAVAAVLADRLEYHAVSNWLQREVIEKLPSDSLTLRRYYNRNPKAFEAPGRALMIVLALDSRRAADSLAQRFRTPGEAESLAMRAQRSGTNYTMTVTSANDSTLYSDAVAAGVGGVGAPRKTDTGYRLFKVLGLEPARPQSFDEARPMVERLWYENESDRLIRAKLGELKRGARILRNERALRALVLSRPPRRP